MHPRFQAIAVPVARAEAGPGPGHHCHPNVHADPKPAATRPEAAVVHTPAIDIYEGPDGLVLEADLPGVAESGISVQVEDNVLSLRATVAPPATTEAKALHEEFRPGDFYRSFILSDEVDRSRIVAEHRDGVLRLTLPRAERAKARKIEIQGK